MKILLDTCEFLWLVSGEASWWGAKGDGLTHAVVGFRRVAVPATETVERHQTSAPKRPWG